MANFSYIIADHATAKAAVIDPAWEVGKIITLLEQQQLTLDKVLLTHSHYDHINGLDELFMHSAKVPLYLSRQEADFWQVGHASAVTLVQDAQIELGNTSIEMLHTPGHTPGSVCYKVGNNLLTGDTLFLNGCGRCDLRGGDAGVLYTSLDKLKHSLSTDINIFPGHNYYCEHTTDWQLQLSGNPFLQFNTQAEFINYRQ